MSKKNKNFNKNSNVNSSSPRPELHKMDDIGYMSDEVISDYMGRLESERNKLFSTGRETYFWEVEIAYFQHEQFIRQNRNVLHMEYFKTLQPVLNKNMLS